MKPCFLDKVRRQGLTHGEIHASCRDVSFEYPMQRSVRLCTGPSLCYVPRLLHLREEHAGVHVSEAVQVVCALDIRWEPRLDDICECIAACYDECAFCGEAVQEANAYT